MLLIVHRPPPCSNHHFLMAKRTDILIRFGEAVRGLRDAAQLTQEDFADKCGLDRTYISGIERGKRNVSLRNIEAVAKALKLSISELFSHVKE